MSYAGTDLGEVPFASPVTDQDRQDLAWYVETYGAHSLGGDEREANRIQARLPEIGKALFKAVFSGMATYERYLDFRNTTADPSQGERVLTIDTPHAAVLSLPWELLHYPDPSGVFLFREDPRISVRRRITGATGGRAPFRLAAKDRLHLLFIVSRPEGAGFLDPRADAAAVIQSVMEQAPGRITWEVLRPATLDALEQRLRDRRAVPVDIVHFDGHGVFSQVSEDDIERDPACFGRSIASELHRERRARGGEETGAPVGIGFLLFEQDNGSARYVSAADLTDNLFRARIGLVVLSACQTAALDAGGDPMASVAGRLTATGIPAILAMTHAVLAVTTQHLFGRFYASLAQGRGIASALDDARAWLANHPEKFEVQRGSTRQMLRLDDWFLPALFHGGADTPLLTHGGTPAPLSAPLSAQAVRHNLRPAHEAGFFGRRREIWQIERWFAADTRRITLSGFGGVGKTALAQEAARWLILTGPWCRAVLIDYAQVQSDDALGVALSTLGAVLGETLTDPAAAARALAAQPTLLLLDNLETLPPAGLAPLLDAAVAWSEPSSEGALTRVLLTTRTPDLGHPGYRIEGTRVHRRIRVEGLGSAAQPDDALDWFRALRALPGADPDAEVPPPARDELIALFDQVAFHPLSIAVLAEQLRTRPARQLGVRLTALLDEAARSGIAQEGTPVSLIASLRLSLDRLDEADRQALGRLGVFQGGAMEDNLLAITGLGGADGTPDDGARASLQSALDALESGDLTPLLQIARRPDGTPLTAEDLPQLKDQAPQIARQLRVALAAPPRDAGAPVWPRLRRQLESAALIQAESIPGVGPAYLRFHPTLAPLLWAGLDAQERARLTLAHRQRYYQLAGYLYQADEKSPDQARAIALRELPNLLHAVDQALAAGDPDAVQFIDWVNRFLRTFGRTREVERLTCRAESAGGAVGSQAWFLAQSNRGEQLFDAGQVAQAAACFQVILGVLGEAPSDRLALTLSRLGRCDRAGGRPDLAEAHYRRGIAVTQALDQNDWARRHWAALHTDLGDVLRDQGRYGEARACYGRSLERVRAIGDTRSEGAVLGQLGALALAEGDLREAVSRYQEALTLFQRLREPATEAVVQHLLGMAFQRAGQREQAERHYRESAAIKNRLGDLAGAAQTWNQLAGVCASSGRPEAAETWYRKAIEGGRASGDTAGVSKRLNNLADLLQGQPGRLAEARRLAEEALAIQETLDPGAAAIWKTYALLARIAERESRPEAAAGYRRLARESKSRFAGTAHEVRRFAPVIAAVALAAGGHPEARTAADEFIRQYSQAGGENTEFAQSMQRILAGERDPQSLCRRLSFSTAPVVEAILQAIADPAALAALLESPAADAEPAP